MLPEAEQVNVCDAVDLALALALALAHGAKDEDAFTPFALSRGLLFLLLL